MWSSHHRIAHAEMCYVEPLIWKKKKKIFSNIEQKITYFHSFSSYTFFKVKS